jgi:hypothetical protein
MLPKLPSPHLPLPETLSHIIIKVINKFEIIPTKEDSHLVGYRMFSMVSMHRTSFMNTRMWWKRNNSPYIFKCKCVLGPSTDDNLIFIQSVLDALVHLLHKWWCAVLCCYPCAPLLHPHIQCFSLDQPIPFLKHYHSYFSRVVGTKDNKQRNRTMRVTLSNLQKSRRWRRLSWIQSTTYRWNRSFASTPPFCALPHTSQIQLYIFVSNCTTQLIPFWCIIHSCLLCRQRLPEEERLPYTPGS